MRFSVAPIALALFLVAGAASAEVRKHPTAGLQFELPDGWTTRTNAGTLVAEPPDKKIYLSFAVIDETKIDGYVTKWAEGMKGGLTDLQIDIDDKVEEVNGLQQIYSMGSALLEGKPIQWDLTIVKGGTKVLAVMALGENLDGDVVQNVYASIQRSVSRMKRMSGIDPNDPNSGAVYPDEEAPAEEEEPAEEPPPSPG
jgi:predicted Zn-dependent protease